MLKEEILKKKLYRVIQLILLALILYSAYQISSYFYSRQQAQKELDSYQQIVEDIRHEQVEEGEESEQGTDSNPNQADKMADKGQVAQVSLARFRQLNKDIVSYINIEDLGVSYPVVHKDNNYYLRRNLKEEYSIAGSIFMEEANKTNFGDMNTIIYGHNMNNAITKSAQMFEPIIQYEDQDFVDQGKGLIIEMFTDQGVNRYQVFSAYYSHAYYDYRTINMSKSEWIDYLEKMKDLSIADFGPVKMDENSQILTLSTCDNITDDGRFAVHAVLINDWND